MVVAPITHSMEHTKTQQHLTKSDDSESPNDSSTKTQLSKSKSQKKHIKSHAQLTQEVRDITSKHRLKLSDGSCSTSERKG